MLINEVVFHSMVSSPTFTQKAVLSTNHWKGERKRSFCLQAEQAEIHRNHDLTIVGFSES